MTHVEWVADRAEAMRAAFAHQHTDFLTMTAEVDKVARGMPADYAARVGGVPSDATMWSVWHAASERTTLTSEVLP